MYHTGPQPSTDAWISGVVQLVCGFGFILRQLPEREHGVVVPRHRVQHFHVLLSSLQRASPSSVEDSKARHLRCVRTTLCPVAARLTSRQKVVIETALKEMVIMVLKAGTSQTWPVAVLIQPTTTSPAAGPPASS